MTSRPRPSRPISKLRTARRGVTLLETVLGSVLLALTAAALMSAVGYVRTLNAIEEQRLACAEIGNRLLLLKLDDDQTMPGRGAPIAYSGRTYRWSIDERPIRVEAREPSRRQRTSGGVGLSRLRELTVRVWLSEQSGGSASPNANVPSVEIVRMYDPLLPTNPDTLNNMIGNEQGIERFIQQLLESQSGGSTTAPPTPAPNGGGGSS